MNKNSGFTLAEVLITLGIIGVVAAMTIPTLIANTRSQQYRSQFKKTLSTLNQAARMSQAQYDFDFGGISASSYNKASCETENPQSDKTMCALLNGTLVGAKYLGDTLDPKSYPIKLVSNSAYKGSDLASDYLMYSLSDGANLLFPATYRWELSMMYCTLSIDDNIDNLLDTSPSCGSHGCSGAGLKQCIGFIDVNGSTRPNKEVECAAGTTTTSPSTSCEVDNASMGDIFPVVFHDGTVEPATNAAAYVLHTAK